MNDEQNQNYQSPERPKEGQVGPIIATIIVILVLVVGGLYFWGERLESLQDQNETAPTNNDVPELSESDEIKDLEADLEGLEIDDFEDELQDIEAEFGI